MNTVTLMGRLSQEPETRYTQSGEAVYNFNFAVNRRFIRSGGPEADFFRCVAFGKTGERMSKLSIGRGTKLLIQGELQNQVWTDKNGNKRETTQIIVNDFDFCESKNTQAQGSAPAPARTETATKKPAAETPEDAFMRIPDGLDEDLPFV